MDFEFSRFRFRSASLSLMDASSFDGDDMSENILLLQDYLNQQREKPSRTDTRSILKL